MDRRNFIKFIGLTIGALIVPKPVFENSIEAGSIVQIKAHVPNGEWFMFDVGEIPADAVIDRAVLSFREGVDVDPILEIIYDVD